MAVEYRVSGVEDLLFEFSKALANGEKYLLGSAIQARGGRGFTFQTDGTVDEAVKEVLITTQPLIPELPSTDDKGGEEDLVVLEEKAPPKKRRKRAPKKTF
jgi:hypothetical protein